MPTEQKLKIEGISGISSFQTHRERQLQRHSGHDLDGDEASTLNGDEINHSWNDEDSYVIDVDDYDEIEVKGGKKRSTEEKQIMTRAETGLSDRSARHELDIDFQVDGGDDEDNEDDKKDEHNNDSDEMEEPRLDYNGEIDGMEPNETSMSLLEEEIGLNEAMLESLHSKLTTLQTDVQFKRVEIERHKANIQALDMNETQLRNSLDTNVTLMKGVTVTLEKCIQRLRKKLDEKIFISSVPENSSEKEKSDVLEEANDDAKNLTSNDDHEQSQYLDQIPLQSLDIENKTCRIEEHNKSTEPEHLSNVNSDDVEAKALLEEAIGVLYLPIEIPQPHPPLKIMERIWSQSYPTQHSNTVQAPIFPLHAPISDAHLMARIIMVSQLEIITRREEMKSKRSDDKQDETFKDISLKQIKNTCLDVFSFCQYDPFILKEMRKNEQKNNSAAKICPLQNNNLSNTDEIKKMATVALDEEESNDKKERKGEVLTKQQHDIDPHTMICRYDLIGTCVDDSCPYQHLTAKQPMYISTKNTYNFINMSRLKSVKKNVFLVQLPPLQLPPSPLQETQKKGSSETAVVSGSAEKKNDAPNTEVLPIIGDEDKKHRNFNKKRSSCAEIENSSNIMHDIQPPKRQRKQIPMPLESSCNANLPTLSDEIQDEDSILTLQDSAIGTSLRTIDDTRVKDIKDSNFMQEFVREDDYIGLPEIESESESESENESESESVHNPCEDSNADLKHHVSEPILDSEVERNAVDEKLLDDEIYEENDMKPVILTDVLSLFGFVMISDGVKEGTTSPSSYKLQFIKSGALKFEGTANEMMQIRVSLQFVVATSNSIRLCLHAGRYDLYHALSQLANRHLEHYQKNIISRKKDSEKEGISTLDMHYKIIKKIVRDIGTIADGCFFGRGSTTCGGVFHAQLCMGIISHFLRAYRYLFDKQQMVSMDTTFSKKSLKLFVQYKEFIRLILNADSSPDDYADPDENLRERFRLPDCISLLDNLFTEFASTSSSPTETTINLIKCATSGQLAAKGIATLIFASEEYSDSPHLIIDRCLHPLMKIIEKHSTATRMTIAEEAIHNKVLGITSSAFALQILYFVLFGPSVFTCLAAISSFLKERRCDGFNRHYGTLVEVKKILMQIVQCFDFSGITRGNFEGQLLLAPFFGLLVNFLISLGSFAKCQVLLETTLYSPHASSSVRNWSIYSELLWSQLIQLQMIFPSRKFIAHTLSHVGDDTISAVETNTSSLDYFNLHEYDRILPRRIIEYGVYANKIFLPGDSSMVRCALHFTTITSASSKKESPKKSSHFLGKKKIGTLDNIRSVCEMLSKAHLSSTQLEKINLNMKNLLNVYVDTGITITDGGLTCCLPDFPHSLLLFGGGLKQLHLDCCGFESLPATFGLHLKGLNILSIAHNRMCELPSSFGFLMELKSLDIRGNRFKCIPSCLPRSKNLIKLSASKNMIKNISELCHCKYLKQVDLRDNEIGHVPTNLPLILTSLSQLQLEGNPILLA